MMLKLGLYFFGSFFGYSLSLDFLSKPTSKLELLNPLKGPSLLFRVSMRNIMLWEMTMTCSYRFENISK
jgi:hypothetical protein